MLFMLESENYPTSQLLPLGTVLTLTLKHLEVKTPLTAHTVYTTETT